MAAEIPFQVPINLNRLELRNAVLQNLSSPPAAKTGLVYYDTVQDTPGHFNSLGVFVPWDVSKATALPNSVLANSSVTIGSTAIALGATVNSLAGLTSIAATTFTGALTGNASTASKLATARTIGITGLTATGASFDGSGAVNINVTAVPTSLLTGTLAAGQMPALSGDITNTAGSLATTIANGAVTLAKMANLTASSLLGNPTVGSATPQAIGLSAELSFNGTTKALQVTPAGITNAMLTNSSVTLGSTVVALGATVTALAGLTSITATTINGALSGNASTATKLATARTIGITGLTATAASFDGSASVNINVTAVPASLLTGTLAAAQMPILTGDVTTVGGSLATTIANGAVTNAKLANSSVTIGTTAIALGAASTTLAGLTSVASTSFTGALTGNASTATKLATARTIALSGGATGTATAFDGSANINIAVTALDASTITGTMSASHIGDLATVVQGYRLDQFAAPTAAVSMGGQRLTNLSDASANTDAVTLQQLNAAVSAGSAGLTPHNSVRLATAGPISTLSGLLTIDGKTTVAGDRVLVKDHTDPTKNGIYVAATGAWALASDSTQGRMVTGSMMLVTDGVANTGSQWWLTTSGTITIGTTALTYSEYGLNDGRIFGDGLTNNGATVTVKPSTGISVTAAGVAVDTTTVVRKVTATIGDGTATSFAVSHTLSTLAVTVSVINLSTMAIEFAGISVTDANTVTVTFGAAPAVNSYMVVIHG